MIRHAQKQADEFATKEAEGRFNAAIENGFFEWLTHKKEELLHEIPDNPLAKRIGERVLREIKDSPQFNRIFQAAIHKIKAQIMSGARGRGTYVEQTGEYLERDQKILFFVHEHWVDIYKEAWDSNGGLRKVFFETLDEELQNVVASTKDAGPDFSRELLKGMELVLNHNVFQNVISGQESFNFFHLCMELSKKTVSPDILKLGFEFQKDLAISPRVRLKNRLNALVIVMHQVRSFEKFTYLNECTREQKREFEAKLAGSNEEPPRITMVCDHLGVKTTIAQSLSEGKGILKSEHQVLLTGKWIDRTTTIPGWKPIKETFNDKRNDTFTTRLITDSFLPNSSYRAGEVLGRLESAKSSESRHQKALLHSNSGTELVQEAQKVTPRREFFEQVKAYKSRVNEERNRNWLDNLLSGNSGHTNEALIATTIWQHTFRQDSDTEGGIQSLLNYFEAVNLQLSIKKAATTVTSAASVTAASAVPRTPVRKRAGTSESRHTSPFGRHRETQESTGKYFKKMCSEILPLYLQQKIATSILRYWLERIKNEESISDVLSNFKTFIEQSSDQLAKFILMYQNSTDQKRKGMGFTPGSLERDIKSKNDQLIEIIGKFLVEFYSARTRAVASSSSHEDKEAWLGEWIDGVISLESLALLHPRAPLHPIAPLSPGLDFGNI